MIIKESFFVLLQPSLSPKVLLFPEIVKIILGIWNKEKMQFIKNFSLLFLMRRVRHSNWHLKFKPWIANFMQRRIIEMKKTKFKMGPPENCSSFNQSEQSSNISSAKLFSLVWLRWAILRRTQLRFEHLIWSLPPFHAHKIAILLNTKPIVYNRKFYEKSGPI